MAGLQVIENIIGCKRYQEADSIKSISKCDIHPSAKIYNFVDLYGCSIGKNTKIDSFAYIEGGVKIGEDCKIRTHVFIPAGVTIGDRVFIASGVKFTNDRYPKIGDASPKLENTVVEDDVSIGAGAIILPGVRIGRGSLIGAGTVVTHDVPPKSIAISKGELKVKERK